MDIFVRNIPDQASNRNLETFFRDKFQPFHIHDFSCQKLRRRGCAIVTVLDGAKAQHFLNSHGATLQQGQKRSVTRPLKYMNRDLLCAPSKSKPDEVLLQTLRKDANDKANQTRNTTSASGTAEHIERNFMYNSVRCGVWKYQASQPVFVSHSMDSRKGSIMFGKRNIALVANSNETGQWRYRLDVPYASVLSVAIGNTQDPSITLTLCEAPRVYHDPARDLQSLPSRFGSLNLRMGWPAKSKRIRVTSLGGVHEGVISNCFVYRILIAETAKIRPIRLLYEKGREMPPSIPWSSPVYMPRSSYKTEMARLDVALLNVLDFGVQFQVRRLAQNGYLDPSRVIELLPPTLQILGRSGGLIAAEAVRQFSRRIPFTGPDVDGEMFAIENLKQLLYESENVSLREQSHGYSRMQQHSHIGLVHKATVTPAGIYLEGPELETTNRVLRRYPNNGDYFIRVTFCDEDGERVSFDRAVSLEKIFHSRFKKVLNGAISIAGRHFEFLGFSHSSLRDQTCWFMAPFVQDGVLLNAPAVIARLGDFSAIRSPAKCAARIGQAFSSTDGTVKISTANVRVIPDVERNGRFFSDGVGTISTEVLAMIWKDYTPLRESRPTLFQIRYAGAKGMVSLDTRLEGKSLLLRKSMIKFTGSGASDIEICGSAARPLPMYLNRQLIKIMEDLGIHPDIFMGLQNTAVERLRCTTLSPAHAASFLERERVGKAARVPWLIRKLQTTGFDFLEDPFLRGTVELAVLSQLRELKHRSRIFVENGVTLYGIMDETDTLTEGQIYCCTESHVITGEVAVTRAPALHPGDIQIVMAVDVPDGCPLNALHNCVVFSQRGQRDLPSQLSGGDLDGDLFNIIYDPQLLPPRVVEPADYPRVTARDIGRQVTREDMTDFFIEFMENDQLGRIAMLHMQLADRKDGGTQHPDCITLAQLHSTAVDFSKTGIQVDMTKSPKSDLNRPDFMAPSPRIRVERSILALEEQSPQSLTEEEQDLVSALDPDAKSYRYYESKNVLGRLYRAIDEKNFLAELQKRARELESTERSDQTLIHRLWVYVKQQTRLVLWDHYRAWAREIKEAYETQLLDTIYQYSTHPAQLISEMEVFVGTLLGKSGGGRTRRLREMSTDMREKFERDVAFTVRCITKGSQEEDNDEALERSIACLAVAVEEPGIVWERARKLESFRYIAAAVCLGEVERFQKSLRLLFPV